MRRLEDALGLALLERSPAGTRLTAAGQVVAGWAAEVMAAAGRLVEGAAALRGDEAGAVSVAASLTVAEYLLPRWLTRLRSVAPEARVAVAAVNSAAVLAGVARGEYPLGFVETPDSAPGLRTSRIARDELIVVVAPGHPWARAAGLDAAALAAVPLVARERGSGTRLAAERALAGAGLRPAEPVAELPTTAGIRTAVASGLAPALLSILTVRDDLAAGRLVRVPLTDLRIVRELRAVWRPDTDLPAALRTLLRVARADR
ncbi:LysR family transcriptional regulator [Leifsonia xyli subsp. cynodontis DSM 46306]|jgi:DNA-binding transcriptional LysR family regulator|uniref:HTH lysR-type domain-containing protein n=1 Tax=Leifsonia xyli subsp. cynodontis DSM 46306 TaxID=1389489 RepID=U3PG26_LEIXC|nr:LysR family transcriptional regulator [Leifsonia xyli subsp. cynodontis DSM 46306]